MLPANPGAIAVPLLVTVGVVLLAVGIGRIRLRWLAAGAAILAAAALLVLLGDQEPWQGVEIVSLAVRTIDADDGSLIHPARVSIERGGFGPDSVSTTEPGGLVRVSALIEVNGNGFLSQPSHTTGPLVDVEPYALVVVADGYSISRMPLAQLLPRDWPLVAPQGTIEVRLERVTSDR